MMNINGDNYESYLLDYLEGSLSPGEIREVEAFLLLHPEIREEFEGVGEVSLNAGNETFGDLSSLHKSEAAYMGIGEDDFRMVARMEGDLSPDDAERFDNELERDSRLGNLYRRFIMTRLIADPTIQYPAKKLLKKRVRRVPAWIYTVAAAAAVAAIGWLIWPELNQVATDPLEQMQAPGQEGGMAKPQQEDPVTSVEETVVHAKNPVAKASQKRLGFSQEPEIVPTSRRDHLMVAGMAPKSAVVLTTGISIPMNLSTSSHTMGLQPPQMYSSLGELAFKYFRIKVLKQEPSLVHQSRFSLWEVADAGIRQVNNLAGTEMDFARQYNDSGEIERVSFNSRLLELSTPIRRP